MVAAHTTADNYIMNFSPKSTQFIIIRVVLFVFLYLVIRPQQYFFLNDDFIHIPLAASGSFFNRSFIRPVSDLTLYLDHLLWQKNAAGYHFTNVLLHLLNAGCVQLLASRLFQKFSPVAATDWRPWLAATLFLVNGCQTESVFWIIGRGGSLAALFGMISLISYFNKERSGWWVVLSFVSFIIGLFAYEAALALPLLVTIFYLAEKKNGQGSKTGLFAMAGFWAICILYFLYRYSTGPILNTYELGALRQFDVFLLLYNFNTLAARSLVPPGGAYFLLAIYVAGMLLVAFMAGGYLKDRNRRPLASVMLLSIFVSVLPFITLGADTHDSESGRFVYFSAVFGCIFLVELVANIRRGSIRVAVAALLVIIHAWFFYSTGRNYRLAGQVVKQSLECMSGATGTAQLVEMPTQYHGALIFRSGLPEALHWYNGQKLEVNIASSKEMQQVQRLSCISLPGQSINSFEVGDGVRDTVQLSLQPGSFIFQWTDSSIVRIHR